MKHTSADGQWFMDPNSLLFLNNRIYVLSAGNLCTCVLQYNHDHILAKHFGQNKTLELVCHGYSWPSLYADVHQFCKSYVTCMQSKPQYHKPYRSLKQLPISEWPWNSISMDFIKKLLSFSRFDIILVIVDWLTKQAIFISAHDTIMSICPSCVFQTQCSFPYHLWQRLGVCVKLLPILRYYSWHAASLHFRLLPQRWWTNWTHESDSWAISLYIL